MPREMLAQLIYLRVCQHRVKIEMLALSGACSTFGQRIYNRGAVPCSPGTADRLK
jgi:hypothetical protein